MYARVSSQDQKQKGGFDRQKARILEYCATKEYKVEAVLVDVCSGMKVKRPHLKQLFKLVPDRKINRVVIEYEDRLTRFCFEVFETFFNSHGVEIECVEEVFPKSFENELVEDMLSLLSSFSSKIYGKRSADRRRKTKEAEHILKFATAAKRQKLDSLGLPYRNWNQTRKEIKDYIGFVISRFPWDTDVVVMENILNITQKTRGRVGKETRKMLGHWNVDLLYRRMADKAEQHRVFLAFAAPAYSSQTSNSCRAIDKKSRNGEVFKCAVCGHADDADHNASMNILQRCLDGHVTVARGTERT